MVMGGDSCSEGCWFKFQHRRLDRYFSHIFVVKNCNVCLKGRKLNKKRPGMDKLKK